MDTQVHPNPHDNFNLQPSRNVVCATLELSRHLRTLDLFFDSIKP